MLSTYNKIFGNSPIFEITLEILKINVKRIPSKFNNVLIHIKFWDLNTGLDVNVRSGSEFKQ